MPHCTPNRPFNSEEINLPDPAGFFCWLSRYSLTFVLMVSPLDLSLDFNCTVWSAEKTGLIAIFAGERLAGEKGFWMSGEWKMKRK